MNWADLLSKTRLGEETKKILDLSGDGRSEFQRDFDRIVFSSAFRRLQDKTQVFPMPESDFVHTRLTHSLEVSCVGRSLGNMAGEKILQRHPELSDFYSKFHFGEIVAAACLAHDIGNPPFGHSGEDAISDYFRNGSGRVFEIMLDDEKQWYDFSKFEGNAQGFRIITRLQNPNMEGGLQLTAATLASFLKYPKESYIPEETADKIKVNQDKKIYKKFGFFQAEKENFNKIVALTGMKNKSNDDSSLFYSRHPLSYLVEAADDICYRIMDLEDGFRLGLMSFEDTENLLRNLIGKSVLKNYDGRDNNDKIGYLRAKAMSMLVSQLSSKFIENEESILEGEFLNELIDMIDVKDDLKLIKDISVEKIYSHKSVIERETAGYEVLGGLLDTFITAVNEAANGKLSRKNEKVLCLLPKQFLAKDGKPDKELYIRLLKITDFVSGMTDSYAVSLYRKLKGIALPNM